MPGTADKRRPMRLPSLKGVPRIPQDEEGPVFAEPWEARAFGLVIHMYQQGQFTWPEWVQYLSAEIAAAKEAGRPDHGPAYYKLWMTAATKLFTAKGLIGEAELGEKEIYFAANPVPPHGTAHREAVTVDRGRKRFD